MIFLNVHEQRLIDAYQRQVEHYDDALRIVNEDALTLEPTVWANRLQSILQQVDFLQHSMSAEKLAWTNSCGIPSAELREILAKLAIRLYELTMAIDRRSDELMKKKQRLLPVLDGFIRHRQMMQRYVQYGKEN